MANLVSWLVLQIILSIPTSLVSRQPSSVSRPREEISDRRTSIESVRRHREFLQTMAGNLGQLIVNPVVLCIKQYKHERASEWFSPPEKEPLAGAFVLVLRGAGTMLTTKQAPSQFSKVPYGSSGVQEPLSDCRHRVGHHRAGWILLSKNSGRSVAAI